MKPVVTAIIPSLFAGRWFAGTFAVLFDYGWKYECIASCVGYVSLRIVENKFVVELYHNKREVIPTTIFFADQIKRSGLG